MNATQLTINGIDLNTNNEKVVFIKASNFYMLGLKYYEAINNGNFHVEAWRMTSRIGEAGNKGLNAGAYLCEEMEELSGMNLA